ncbi:MAG: ankyrin repeat domain-containing protein, partial [Pseudomonadota bacterium]
MKPLPVHPNIDHLKRQAKDLLAALRREDPDAIARLTTALPAAAGRAPVALARLRLHDAQSCLAREYGFPSWKALSAFVEMARARSSDARSLAFEFAQLAYSGDVAGGMGRPRPEKATLYLDLLIAKGPLDPWIACAAGDVARVRQHLQSDPDWIGQTGGPLNLPPLFAATHSGLIRLPRFRAQILKIMQLLLEAGSDPNQTIASRWPPASLEAPSEDQRLSALYGAAGVNHDADAAALLLDAGADPNDNETLYHAVESGEPALVQKLLEAGATVSGTNALYHALDYDNLDLFNLLLGKTETLDHPPLGPLLIWAIRRRRSLPHFEAVLAKGADPRVKNDEGISARVMALRYGLADVAALLEEAGAAEDICESDLFLAACARADAAEARRLQALYPHFPEALTPAQLRMFPELAAAGCAEAVTLMADLGFPIGTRGGDWNASPLNHAVMRGDAALAWRLLSHGAQWTEEHGYGDNVSGTL